LSKDVETVKVPAQLMDQFVEMWAVYRKLPRTPAASTRCEESFAAKVASSLPRGDTLQAHPLQLGEPEPEMTSTTSGGDSSDDTSALECSGVSTPAYPSSLSTPRVPTPAYPSTFSSPRSPEPRQLARPIGYAQRSPLSQQPSSQQREIHPYGAVPLCPATVAKGRSPSQHAVRRVNPPVFTGAKSHNYITLASLPQPCVATSLAPSTPVARGVSLVGEATVACSIQQTVTITQTIQIPLMPSTPRS